MASGFPIRHGSGSLETGLGIGETAYKTGQHGSTNRGAGRPYAPGRIGPVFMPAPPAPPELPDVRDTDPASAVFTSEDLTIHGRNRRKQNGERAGPMSRNGSDKPKLHELHNKESKFGNVKLEPQRTAHTIT